MHEGKLVSNKSSACGVLVSLLLICSALPQRKALFKHLDLMLKQLGAIMIALGANNTNGLLGFIVAVVQHFPIEGAVG